MDVFSHMERWGQEYIGLKGQRIRVKLREEQDLSEVLWLLGQEHDYLICAREPRQEEGGRRQLSIINADSVVDFEPLQSSPIFPLGATPSSVEALYIQARVAVHALTPSGSRGSLEITGMEPQFGGYFAGPNWALGFALIHLHGELQDMGLVTTGDIPFRAKWREVPSRVRTRLLEPDEQSAASLIIQIAEMPGDQLSALTVPLIHDRAGRALSSVEKVMVWGYESLWQNAVDRRLIPSGAHPRVRRSGL